VDIIEEAFRIHSTLSFVVVLTVEEKHSISPPRVERHIKGTCYLSAVARRRVDDAFRNELGAICRLFPVPCDSPANALRVLESKRHEGYSFMGGYRMSNGQISISSRTLTDILAGNLDYSTAAKDTNGPLRNLARVKDIFRAQLRAGRMISKVSVVHCPDEDDDWIKIEFGPTDGAISKFR
jgi:hypothetical protein